MSDDDRIKTLEFYKESVDDRMEDGMSEEEAVESLGTVDQIVNKLKADMPVTEMIKEKIDESRKKTGSKAVWITLAILGFPVWLPLLIALLAIVFSVYVSIWAIVLGIAAALLAIALSGFGLFASGLAGIFLFSPATGLALIGTGLILTGLFICFICPFGILCKKTAQLTGLIFKKIKECIVGNGGHKE